MAVKKELILGGNAINSYDTSGSMKHRDTIDLSKVESFEDATKNVDREEFRKSQEDLSYVSQCSPCFFDIFWVFFLNQSVYFVFFTNFHIIFGGQQLFNHGQQLLNLKRDTINKEFEDYESQSPDSPSPSTVLEGLGSHTRGSSDI